MWELNTLWGPKMYKSQTCIDLFVYFIMELYVHGVDKVLLSSIWLHTSVAYNVTAYKKKLGV